MATSNIFGECRNVSSHNEVIHYVYAVPFPIASRWKGLYLSFPSWCLMMLDVSLGEKVSTCCSLIGVSLCFMFHSMMSEPFWTVFTKGMNTCCRHFSHMILSIYVDRFDPVICGAHMPYAPWCWNIYQHLPEQNHPFCRILSANIPAPWSICRGDPYLLVFHVRWIYSCSQLRPPTTPAPAFRLLR